MSYGMIELAGLCDFLVCSEEFAREYVGSEHAFDPEQVIRQMKSLGSPTVTITLGEQGSITCHGETVFRAPAYKVDVVDTTGAGDVFHGGYIYGLLQKWELKEVLRFASAIAALKCRRLGGRAGIPSLEEVHPMLRRSPSS